MKPFLSPFLDSVIVIDTETGGLDPLKNAVLQVAFVASKGRQIQVDVLDAGVCEIDALAINHIDLDLHETKALSLHSAATLLFDFYCEVKGCIPNGKVILGGHNTGFDIAFLRRLFRDTRIECPFSWHRTLDTHTLLFAKYARGEIPYEACNLEGALKHFGIRYEKAERHTALGDARVTRVLLEKLLEG